MVTYLQNAPSFDHELDAAVKGMTANYKNDIPNYWPTMGYRNAKGSAMIYLRFFPADGIYQHVFRGYINDAECMEVLNELNVKYGLNLDTWVQTQPPITQDLLHGIRSPPNPEMINKMLSNDVLQHFDNTDRIVLESFLRPSVSFLAFTLSKWPLDLVLEQLRQLPLMMITTLLWYFTELLWKQPALIELVPLPEQMPPLHKLIPTYYNHSCCAIYAPIFKLLTHRYGFERLEREIKQKRPFLLFYLYITNDELCKDKSLAICLNMPVYLSTWEKAEWLAYHFTRNEPVTNHSVLGFPLNFSN